MSLVIFPLTDAHVADPAALRGVAQAIQEQGFNGVLFRLQSATQELLAEPVIATFKSAVESARRHSLQAWLNLDVRHATQAFPAQHSSKRLQQWIYDGQQFHPQALDAIDYAAPETNQFLKRLLSRYRQEIPQLDGVWCESPGYVADENSVFMSDDFDREFADRIAVGVFSQPAYDLRQKLDALVKDTPEAVRVRCDYFSAWADMVFRVQSMLRTEAERLWGRTTEVGLVLDCGEPAAQQLRRGTMDYFRFSRDTTTHLLFRAEGDDAALTAFAEAFARSLAKYHPTTKATYVAMPLTPEQQEQRLEAWEWREASPKPESQKHVAVIYHWRTLAALLSPQVEECRRSLMRLCLELSHHQIAFDLVPPQAMTTAIDMTDTGGFQRPEETYDAVIYPHPFVHVKPDWETLKFFIENKGRILLYGTAPRFLVDGTNVEAEWARLPRTDNWQYMEESENTPQQAMDWLAAAGFRVEESESSGVSTPDPSTPTPQPHAD